MNFVNKVVLITGASSGIGASTAIYLSKLSAKLALIGRNKVNLQETALKCESEKGIKPLAIVADVTVESDVERIVKETVNHFSKLDVLVNNAGISLSSTIQTTTLDMFDNLMKTNIRGPFHLTSLAVPHLLKTKGVIVNVSSLASIRPTEKLLVYGMSKAAMDHFTQSLAYGLGPEGIRVNSVNPGVIPTDIMRRAGLDNDMREAVYKQMETLTPLGKLAECNDVAAMIAFLASDLSKSITGTIQPIDGGKFLV